MTLEQVVQEIFEGLGEPSDLEYRDRTTELTDTDLVGWRRMVDAVNTGLLALLTWKFPDGRVVRFRQLEELTTFRSEVLTGNVTGSVDSAILVTDFPVQVDDYYAGWAIEIGTATYRVLQSQTNDTDTELFLLSLPSEDPNGTATLSKREYRFADNTAVTFGNFVSGIGYNPDNGRPLELLEVFDMDDSVQLEGSNKSEPLLLQNITLGTPTVFYKIPQGLRFDQWPDEVRTYTVRYARAPHVLAYTDTAVEPELPEQFHAALVLYGLWWGFRRMQENTSAYAVKKDLEDTLRRIRTEYDFQGDFTAHQFKYAREGV